MQQHCDEDDLVLLALGEPVPTEVTEHVATCELCAAERDSFVAVVATVRAAEDDEPLDAPAPSVWAGIEAELGLAAARSPSGAGASLAGERSSTPAPDALSTGQGFSFPDPGSSDVADDEASGRAASSTPRTPVREDAEVVELAARRSGRRPWAWIAAAAAAGVVVGGVGGGWISSRTGVEPQPTVVAQAPLDPLPGWDGASGEAVVHTAADGTRTLVLDVEATVPDDGFREVWLIDRDVTRLVSIGVLEGSSGTFVLPSGIDLDDFAVVDVSQEHFDGDPAHSGDSIVRGILGT